MQTTSVLFTTCLLAALASSQSTITHVGEPEQLFPTFSLNPAQSSIVSKYADDIGSYDDKALTNSFDQSIGKYLATETAFPVNSIISTVLQGNPIPTSVATAIPASFRDSFLSDYDNIASIAKSDLSADGSLSTIAPYYVDPAEASSRPKITQVVSGAKSARSTGSGVASTGFATTASPPSSGSGVAAGSSGIAAASGSGPVGTGGSGSVALSTTASPPAATSPITSAKPSSGASERLSAGAGALLLVGAGFVALL